MNSYRRFIFVSILAGSIPSFGFADFSSSSRGTTSGTFLKLPAGARAVSMGEAYGAVADDASALYWNPAGLTQIPGGDLTLMHGAYIESSFYDYAAYGQNLGTYGAFGVSGQFLSVGNITQTDTLGNQIGTFNPHDMAISLGYAHTVAGFSLGLSGKFIQSTILNTAQTEAVDLGVLSPWFLQERLKLGLTATNLGGQLKFEQEGADLPRAYRVASEIKLTDSWIGSLDGVLPNDNAPYIALGTEYSLKFPHNLGISFRGGLNSRNYQDLQGLNSFSLGVGVSVNPISIDYAFLPMGDLGYTQRVGFSYHWGGSPQETKEEQTPPQQEQQPQHKHRLQKKDDSKSQLPTMKEMFEKRFGEIHVTNVEGVDP